MNARGLHRAVEILASAERVVVSTGAGMSRESGIPTFRDAQEGLWARFSPQELATEQGFRGSPRRVWSWYAERRRRIAACEPHPGHRALVELEALVPEVTVVTQNIDGLHHRAGSREVIEMHGSIRRFKCLDRQHPAGEELPTTDGVAGTEPPPCARCGSPLRPDVVWFGESLPAHATSRASELAERCDVLLVVGTSGTVWPAADLPLVARAAGAPIIEVNAATSEITPVADIFLEGPAGTVLPQLVVGVRTRRAD